MKYGKTEDFKEALSLFAASRGMNRSIDAARDIADELIARQGSADVKEVKAVMVERELIKQSEKHHWLGAVFNKPKKYERTGEIIQANGHDAIVNRWRFRPS